MTYLTDTDKEALFEKAQLCRDDDCELCSEAIPLIESIIERNRAEASAGALERAADHPFAREASASWDGADPATGDHVVFTQTAADWLTRRATSYRKDSAE